MSDRIIIVDQNDNEIGIKERSSLEGGDIYRVSALWVKNSKGDILLARRSFNKKNNPGQWGPAVAGTVDEGESYEENIIKEAEEEIGLKDCQFVPLKKDEYTGEHRHFTQWFDAVVDEDINYFKIKEDEVEELRWFSKKELSIELENNPSEFIPEILGDLLKYSSP